jgi:hypothetical protein
MNGQDYDPVRNTNRSRHSALAAKPFEATRENAP